MSLLTTLLFPEYRRRVLGLLLLHPEKHYHVREVARLTGTTAGTLHRELSKLATAEILLREVSGQQVFYQANSQLPIFEELTSILRKTSGLIDVLTNALIPLSEKIDVAFVYGSVARGTENSGSDVDMLIIGEIDFFDVVAAIHDIQKVIGREINPKVFYKDEWKKRVAKGDAFTQEILKNKKLFIIGKDNDLEQPTW